MATLPSRLYQIAGIDATLEAFQSGIRAALLCLATGTGKTHSAAEILRESGVGRDGRTVLWVAHQDRLLDQGAEAVSRQIPYASIGYELGTRHAERHHQVIFSTVQSLSGARGARLLHAFRDRIVFLVVDEAHRSAASTYRHLIHAVLAGCPRSRCLGLTATPNRPDRVTLADLYEEIAYSYSTRDAIFDGYLVAPRGYRVTTKTSLRGLSSRGSDFPEAELGRRLNTDERNHLALEAWLAYASNTKTLGFCAGTEHTEASAKVFRDAGIPSAALHSKLTQAQQEAVFRDFKAGRLLVLFGDRLFVEGIDIPGVETVLFERPSKSAIYYQQALGRALRPDRAIAERLASTTDRAGRLDLIAKSAKPFARVIDLVDLSANGIMELASLFGPKMAKGRSSLRRVPVEDHQAVEEQSASDDSGSIGVHVVEHQDALRAHELVIEPFDVLSAEAELKDVQSPFTWREERPGERVLYLPRLPVGVTISGSRSLDFERTYAQAYALPHDQRVARAHAVDPTATIAWQDTHISISVSPTGTWEVREWSRRGDEPDERPITTAASAKDAIQAAERHIVQSYRHLLEMLAKEAPWRARRPNAQLRAQLEASGLDPDTYRTAGEASDALEDALASTESQAS